MHYKLEQLYKLDPKLIVTECSSIHTCNVLDNVISDLIKLHIAYNALAKEVLSLTESTNLEKILNKEK